MGLLNAKQKNHASLSIGKCISNHIVGYNLFLTMGTMKKVNPYMIKGWPQMQ
jgi:hypothetical protein